MLTYRINSVEFGRNLPESFGIFWDLESFGIYQNLPESSGIFRNRSEYFGIFPEYLESFEIFVIS